MWVGCACAEPGATGEDRIAELLGTGSDPFRFGYQESATKDHLVPMNASQVAVGQVCVKGILSFRERPSCALVEVGKSDPLQLVREQDLIRVSDGGQGRFGLKKKTGESKYLLVHKILKDSILVAPKKSPETTITIR